MRMRILQFVGVRRQTCTAQLALPRRLPPIKQIQPVAPAVQRSRGWTCPLRISLRDMVSRAGSKDIGQRATCARRCRKRRTSLGMRQRTCLLSHSQTGPSSFAAVTESGSAGADALPPDFRRGLLHRRSDPQLQSEGRWAKPAAAAIEQTSLPREAGSDG